MGGVKGSYHQCSVVSNVVIVKCRGSGSKGSASFCRIHNIFQYIGHRYLYRESFNRATILSVWTVPAFVLYRRLYCTGVFRGKKI